MPKRSLRPVTLRDTWRPKTAGSLQEVRAILLRRLMFSVLLISILLGFSVLLFKPFYHPNVRLFYFSGGDYHAPYTSPVPFFREDAIQFLSSDGHFDEEEAQNNFREWLTPNDAYAALDSITKVDWRNRDLPVIYLSGHATLVDDRPCVHAQNLHFDDLDASAISFEEIFNKLSLLPVDRVLLLLDFDLKQPEDEANSQHDFNDELKKLLTRASYSKIWAITSHASNQRRNISSARKSSAFLSVLVDALHGKGTSQRNSISFAELFQYLVTNTEKLVKSESSDREIQTPVFLGDSKQINHSGNWTVASFHGYNLKEKLSQASDKVKALNSASADEESLEKKEESQQVAWISKLASSKAEAIKGMLIDEVGDNLYVLPTFISEPIKEKIGLIGTIEDDKPTTSNSPDTEATTKLPDGPDLKSLPKALEDLSQLLQLARQYVNYCESNANSKFQPAESIPVAWSYTLTRLDTVEKRLRHGTILDQETIKAELVSLIVAMHQLAIGEGPKLDGNLAFWKDHWPVKLNSEYPAVSLANIKKFNLNPPDATELQNFAAAFEDALDQPTPEALLKLTLDPVTKAKSPNTSLNLDNENILELFYAKQVLQAPNIQWELASRALRILRAIDDSVTEYPTINNEIFSLQESAFSEWLHGYRICIDQIHSDWQQSATLRFNAAEELLTRCQSLASQITESRKTWSHINQQIGNWIAQYQHSALSPSDTIAIAGILEDLLSLQIKLTEKFVAIETSEVAEIQQLSTPLAAQVAALDSFWQDAASRTEQSDWPDNASKFWQINELLDLDYYAGQERGRLLKRWLSWTSSPQADEASNLELSTTRNLNRSELIGSLNNRLLQWKNSLRVAPLSWDPSSSSEMPTIAQLRQQECALKLERIYSPNQFNPKRVLELISRHESAVRLQNRGQLYRIGVRDCTQEERNFYLKSDSILRESIVNLSNRSLLHPISPSPIIIESTPVLSLESESQGVLEITLRNRSSTTQEVWLLAELNSDLLHFESLLGEVIYVLPAISRKLSHSLQSRSQLLAAKLSISDADPIFDSSSIAQDIEQLKRSLRYPVDPTADDVSPSVVLPPNSLKEISVRIGRDTNLAKLQKIVWKSVTKEHYTRAETIVKLPTSTAVQMIAESFSAATQPTSEGLQIDLFPNRKATARFGLRSMSTEGGNYQVRLWLPERPLEVVLPPGELSADATSSLRSAMPNMKLWETIPNFHVTGDKKTHWLSPKDNNITDASKAADTGSTTADTATPNPASDSNAPSSPPPQFSLTNGIIAEITNVDTTRSIWRKIELRTRHPRSYVNVHCSFDSEANIAEVLVTARDASLVPTSGIPIVARVRETLPKGTEAKLTGTLLPDRSLKLYTKVPLATLRSLTVEVDVEGFPRAFVASIPCWKTSVNIPAIIEQPQVTFQNIVSGRSIQPGTTIDNLTILVDSLEDSFQTASDKLEIGWDMNQDRELDSERPIVLHTDRSQEVSSTKYGLHGTELQSRVGNTYIQLPVPTGINRRVNLLAKLTTGGQISWSEPVELIIDGESPTILGIDVLPSNRVPEGTVLTIRVAAEDGNLSGVALVQAAIDIVGVENWSEVKSPISGKKLDDGGWKIDVPTADVPDGRVTLVIAATDRAGNVSSIHRSVVDIIGEEEWNQIVAQRKLEVHGLVTFNDQMVPHAKVSIYKENGDILSTTEADNRGLYIFRAIPVGKYKISAVSVIKNRPRRSEEEVTVKGESDEPILKELQLK